MPSRKQAEKFDVGMPVVTTIHPLFFELDLFPMPHFFSRNSLGPAKFMASDEPTLLSLWMLLAGWWY